MQDAPQTDPILEAGAARLARMMQTGETSAEAVMHAHLNRIEAANGTVNAIVALRDPEDCLSEAREADAARAKGDAAGPLHGLPIAIKDLAATRGLRTTFGSPNWADWIPDADSPMVARIREAGAIIIGKTNTPEEGLGSHTMNPVYGTTKNPWNTDFSCGGSSGGAAVALACRMLPLADGSDMMGSLRNPAGWNNVMGFRPSWGLASNAGNPDLYLHQISTNGPMGRSARDMALLLDVQAGFDPAAPLSHDGPGFLAGLSGVDEGAAKGLRIGWIGDWDGAWPMDDGILATCEGALKVLESLGSSVEPLTPDFPRDRLWQSWIDLRSWAVAGKQAPLYEDEARRARMKPELVWEIERGLALSALDVHRAGIARADWHRTLEGLFQRFDLLAVPSAQVWPFPVEQRWPQEIAGVKMDTYHRWMECVIPASLSGRPAVCVPAGFGPAGLPIGLTLIGRIRGDLEVLEAAAAFETAADWVHAAPPVGQRPENAVAGR